MSLAASAAMAQYPVKPIRMIVPYPPGGPVDVVARPIAQKLTEAWGQAAILDPRPGGGATIGTDMVAKAPPDGYTILLTTAQHTINPAIYPKLPFDVAKDFVPISLLVAAPLLLVTHPSLPVKNVRELIALAKARPGQLVYGSAGNGSAFHMAGELFKIMAQVDIVHVPYKGGAPATTDLVGGHVSIVFNSIVSVIPHVQSGRLRALALTALKRSVLVPDAPTLAESGLPGYEVETWYGALGPAAMPRDAIDKMSSEIDRILKLPDIRERIRALGAEPRGGRPEDFTERITTDLVKWARVAKTAGVKVD
jgi:tripartite-type tricarboxylate transporter receptor subunit TctC